MNRKHHLPKPSVWGFETFVESSHFRSKGFQKLAESPKNLRHPKMVYFFGRKLRGILCPSYISMVQVRRNEFHQASERQEIVALKAGFRTHCRGLCRLYIRHITHTIFVDDHHWICTMDSHKVSQQILPKAGWDSIS